ncbi:retrovirus-related Pol polyprotein from transposon TNT 1-94 [Trichonephila clavipes]|nr:retrovirus-related Pol polyprotein from transposon TNT 1-94 [Trichonephila clavipes]
MLVERIVPLTSNNYHTWKQDIASILIEHDCWNLIKGREQPPSEDSSNKEKLDFDTRKNRVFSTIYLNISEVLRPLISHTTDGKEAWDILHKYFLPDSRGTLIGLLDTFFSCRIQEGEMIGLFAARLQKIINDLLHCDEKISERYKIFQLIRYLPTQFQTIVKSIYRWDDSKFTFNQVLEELIAEESRFLQCSHGGDLVAMNGTVRKVQKQSSHTKEKVNPVKCHNWREIGLEEINCWSKGKNSRKENRQPINTLTSEACISEKDSEQGWIIDSGATSHFCGKRKMFETFKFTNKGYIFLANSTKCPVEGKGTVRLRFGSNDVLLKDVIYCSEIKDNLISGRKLDKDGCTFVGKNGSIIVFNENDYKIITAKLYKGFYTCYPQNISRKALKEEVLESTAKKGDSKELVEKMGHNNDQYTSDSFDVIRELPKLNANQTDCEPCGLAKTKRRLSESIWKIKSTKQLQLIHTAICGPFQKQTEKGYRYFITFIDDMSRRAICFSLKRKDKAVSVFRKLQGCVELFTGKKIIAVRCDNGGEFRELNFDKQLEKVGIKVEFTDTYSPEMKGVAERFNNAAEDAIKVWLKSSNLPDTFWKEALDAFAYSWNLDIHNKLNKTSFEIFESYQPSVFNSKPPFGTIAFVGVLKQQRSKLQMRTKKGIMVGYSIKTDGYKIYLPTEKKVIQTNNVVFGKIMYYNDSRNENKKRSGINLDPSFSESPAKCTRSQNSRKNSESTISDESTTSSSSYYSFSDDESSSSESEIEPIKQNPVVSDQKSEESYHDQTEEISEDSEDDDVDYSAISCNGRNRTDIYY